MKTWRPPEGSRTDQSRVWSPLACRDRQAIGPADEPVLRTICGRRPTVTPDSRSGILNTIRPRVLALVQLPPPLHGSAQVSQYILESQAIRRALEIEAVDISTADQISQIGRFSIRKTLRFLSLLIRTTRFLLLRRYDIVYMTLSLTGLGFYKDSLLALVAKAFRAEIVYHLHQKGVQEHALRSRRRRQFYRFVFANANVIHLSRLLYPDIAEFVSEDKVYYLANGVDDQVLTSAYDRQVAEVPRLLYLSTLGPQKGALLFLEATKRLRDNGYRFEAVFSGNWGPERGFRAAFLDYMKVNCLEDFVYCTGPVYGNEKKSLLNSSHIFVLPTLEDCFPLVLLEAMSCGLPVVVTAEGAIPEIVDEGTGLLAQKSSVEDLVRQLEMLLADSDLRDRMGRAARARYRARYTVETFEQNFVKIIRALLVDDRG